MNCRIMLALVSITHSITIFPAAFHDCDRKTFLVHVHADKFGHKKCSFLEWLNLSAQNLLQMGRPFYNV
jgi:hypothetical protein